MTTWMQAAERMQTQSPNVMIHGQQGPTTRGRRIVPAGPIHAIDPESGDSACGATAVHALDTPWPPGSGVEWCDACAANVGAAT
jgi:hypothetical protein